MATYYIATTGNDSTGNGTVGNPWLTISKAYTSSAANDTIVCAAGTYTWVSQIFSTARTIQGPTAFLPTAVFDGGAAAIGWRGTFTAQNITFQNALATAGAGLFFDVGSSFVQTFTNCFFKTLSTNGDNSFIFARLGGDATFNFTACIIKNPTLVPTFCALFGVSSVSGTITLNLTNTVVYSNITAVTTLDIFLIFNGGSATLNMTNSIFFNDNGTPQTWNNGMTVSYSGSNNCISGYSSPPSLSNQVNADPLFVDPANNNFNLRPTSPCLDAGTAI